MVKSKNTVAAPINPTTATTTSAAVPLATPPPTPVQDKKPPTAPTKGKRERKVQKEIQDNLDVVVIAKPEAPAPVVESNTTPPEPVPSIPVPPTPVETEALNTDDTGDVAEVTTEKKRTRRQVTKESFYNDFEGFLKLYETELADKKILLKQLKQLKSDGFKLLKIKNLGDDRKGKADSNSGFMKPVRISEDLAGFIGLTTDEPITRVLITKKICQHIKEKDLQNPEDRREIIPDLALRKLFKITDEDTEPLTYYGIQKRIQRHIFKLDPATSTS